jgi:glycosyltransferase involved in cell wall biosynthesis
MRFLIVSQYFEPEVGAAQARLGAFARELIRLGHQVEVVTGMPNYPDGVIRKEYRRKLVVSEDLGGVSVHRVWLFAATGSGFQRVLNYFSFLAMSSIGFARSKKPDFIFVESPPPTVMFAAKVFNARWRSPIILNISDLWPDSIIALGFIENKIAVKFLEIAENWCYRSATLVCSVTDGIRSTLENKKGVSPQRIVDLPNGVDLDLFYPNKHSVSALSEFSLGNKDVFIYAGTVGYAQKLETAVTAMAGLSGEFPNARLLIIGGGSRWDEVKSFAKKIGSTNVVFEPFVPLDRIAAILNECHASVVTLVGAELLKGARPSKLFPAMASGIPVLFSGSGEGADLVTSSKSGLVSPPEDAETLAENMRTILLDRTQAKSMGQRGRRFAEERFSWEAIIGSWLEQVAQATDRR